MNPTPGRSRESGGERDSEQDGFIGIVWKCPIDYEQIQMW